MQLESHKVVCGQSMLSNSLRVYLNNKTRLQPIIGLSCVTECVQLSGESDAMYLCEVCVCRLSKTDVRSHIMGSLHRYNYIKVKYPHFVSEWKLNPELSKLAWPLMEMAQILEKREGSGDIQVLKLETAMYEKMTSNSESDALILLRAIRAEQKQKDLQSQSEKPLAQSEYLSIQSQGTVMSPRTDSVQPEKPALQVDKQTIVLENPTALSQNSSGILASSVLYPSLSVQSELNSEDGVVPHRTGAPVKRPASTLPWPHDNGLPLTPDNTAGGQMLLGGGEGPGLEEVPAKPNGCEPVFKVSLSLTDGPLLVERNSFSLEPYPASPGSPKNTPIQSPVEGVSPQPPVTALHLVGQTVNRVVTRPQYKHTAIARLGPVLSDQQPTREECMYKEEEPGFNDSFYLRRDQRRNNHLSEVFRFTDTNFYQGAENLSIGPLMDNNKQGKEMGNICHFSAGKSLAEDDREPDLLYYPGERLAEGGYSSGAMYQSGERSSDRQYLTEEITTDNGNATGVCEWPEEQETEQCRDEIQKGYGLVVEFMVKKQRRGKRRRKMENFYDQQYFQRQPPQQHLVQGFTSTGKETVGHHMGDTADPSWAQWSGPECGGAGTCEGSDTYRREPQGYVTQPRPDSYTPPPEGHRMNFNPYQAASNSFRSIPGPYCFSSNPDAFEPQLLPYPHHSLAPGVGPLPQHLGYEGPPTPHYPQHSMDGCGPPLPVSSPIPSHYSFREDYRGHRPAMVKWDSSESPWF
ncbi:hypothetical protein UPYG_G00335210 [Umbra pygmaea]|uniref:Uncharacterized protein n=1 Tax=Umbra pygmaea TaxID=75934 RepID=A0ABD0WEE1_UMBPY